MTLLVGMYYDNKKGALIASDSRCLSGYDLNSPLQKIFQIQGVTFAFTGTVHMRDELLIELTQKMIDKTSQTEIHKAVQEAYNLRRTWYLGGENPLLNKEKKFSCSGLFGFYSDEPKLFTVDDRGMIQSSNLVQSDGQKPEYALELLKSLYWNNISKEQAINSVVHVINEVSKRNSGVDNQVQIATIEKEGSQILNYNNGDLDFGKFFPIIEELESAHTAESQRLALHILLNGQSKYRSRLENLLSRFKEDGKNPF